MNPEKEQKHSHQCGLPIEFIQSVVKTSERLKAENLLEGFIKEMKEEIAAGGETLVGFHGARNRPILVNCKPMFLALAEKILEGTYVSDLYGLCPQCRHHDGQFHDGHYHWSVCKTHKLRWRAGDADNEETENQTAAWKEFADFEEVKPFYFSNLLAGGYLTSLCNQLEATRADG